MPIAIDILGFLEYQIACPDDVVLISGAVYSVRGDANAFIGGNMCTGARNRNGFSLLTEQ